MEVLWTAPRPLSTRAVADAIARRYPHRAGRAIQTTATLLTSLMAQGWAVGRKRGGTRWVYEPAVSRSAGLSQLAERVVDAFCVGGPSDGWYVVRAALGRLDLEEPGGAPAHRSPRQPKSTAPQALSPPSLR
jgi:predicted transcriptional regulator